MTHQAPQTPNLRGTITPDQYGILASTNPAELTPEAQEIVKGLGSAMLENDYAVVVETDQAGQTTPRAYVTLREGDQGTVISPRSYEAKGLPPLADAQKVMAEQHARRAEEHVAGGTPYFGTHPGAKAGERKPQPPLTSADVRRLEAQRGQYVSQADIDGINAARAEGKHLS